jgi:hypothetical protein
MAAMLNRPVWTVDFEAETIHQLVTGYGLKLLSITIISLVYKDFKLIAHRALNLI